MPTLLSAHLWWRQRHWLKLLVSSTAAAPVGAAAAATAVAAGVAAAAARRTCALASRCCRLCSCRRRCCLLQRRYCGGGYALLACMLCHNLLHPGCKCGGRQAWRGRQGEGVESLGRDMCAIQCGSRIHGMQALCGHADKLFIPRSASAHSPAVHSCSSLLICSL